MKFRILASVATLATAITASAQVSSVDLSTYNLVARYNLPEPTRTTPPANSLLAQEASGVTWNRATNTLFVVGDGGTSVVQVGLTGSLIDSMTLGLDPLKPQGTAYYDPEGIAALGGGQFAIVEERDRVVSKFTYAAGTTLTYADSQHAKLGTTIGNIGIEGISYDPLTTSGSNTGFIAVKEKQPIGIFQTTIDFSTGTASNGSPSTVNSVNLFDPALLGVLDVADVFALSNLIGIGAADQDHLLLLSQESGKITETDRAGNIYSSLIIPALTITPAGTTALTPAPATSVPDQQHEGMTMDDAGNLYVVCENGGGDINYPQLWVYSPVPEPGTCGLVFVGLGLLGAAAHRRKRQSAAI